MLKFRVKTMSALTDSLTLTLLVGDCFDCKVVCTRVKEDKQQFVH